MMDSANKAFDVLLNAIVERTKSHLQSENLNPMLLGYNCQRHAFLPIELNMSSQEHKRRSIQMAACKLVWHECDFAFLISDVALGSQEYHDKGIMPLEIPLDDRKEALMVLGWELKNNNKFSARTFEYKRSGKDLRTVTFNKEPSFEIKAGATFAGNLKEWFEQGLEIGTQAKALLKRGLA